MKPDKAVKQGEGWDQSIRVERIGKYRLKDPYRIFVDIQLPGLVPPQVEHLRLVDGVMEFDPGFLYDGPSGPAVDSDNAMRGALVHDGGYRLIAHGQLSASYQEYFDWLYRWVNGAAGMSGFRSWYQFVTVRRFGGNHLQTNPIKVYP